MKKGKKYDNGKLRMDLIPPEVLIELGKVLTYGLEKYREEDSWKMVEKYRYDAALLRHYCAWKKGEKLDPESKLSHLSHMLANIAFLTWKELHEE